MEGWREKRNERKGRGKEGGREMRVRFSHAFSSSTNSVLI